MGSYTPLEKELNGFTSDELNELYLSGDLDKMYDDYEKLKEGQSKFNFNREKQVKEDEGESVE